MLDFDCLDFRDLLGEGLTYTQNSDIHLILNNFEFPWCFYSLFEFLSIIWNSFILSKSLHSFEFPWVFLKVYLNSFQSFWILFILLISLYYFSTLECFKFPWSFKSWNSIEFPWSVLKSPEISFNSFEFVVVFFWILKFRLHHNC